MATAERVRSFELDLSPCTSLPDQPRDDNDSEATTLENVSENEPEIVRAQHIQIIGTLSKGWGYDMGSILTVI